MTPLQRQVVDLLYPLADFYSAGGVTLPRVTAMDHRDVPEPYRGLLVHERDMTSTLERFWKSSLHLRVLDKHQEDSQLVRQVVLLRDTDERPVEFGAIRINLDAFESDARAAIVECRVPLGAILDRSRVAYTCSPSAYFSFVSDTIAQHAFDIDGSHMLYGRHNTLLDPNGETLAEVVEILPPMDVTEAP